MKRVIYKLILLSAIALFGCKKESGKHCWQIIDAFGNNLTSVCDKTETELKQWAKENMNGATLTSCNYYLIDQNEKQYCWSINGQQIKATETYVSLLKNCFNISATRINCQ